MLRTRFTIPTFKEPAKNAEIPSHQLMLQAGLIAQLTSGLYTWLPLGLRVLRKIETIIREEQNRANCQELLFPLTQPLSLWEESGRSNAYGKELLTMQDRYENTLLFSPTAEEIAVHTCGKLLKSYKDLPQCFYQIQWKFRDEIRPRFGVMRAREFLMKDAYSFDISPEAALERYHTMAEAYLRTFTRMGFTCLPVRADSGAIGGNLSHEFSVLCEGGESTIHFSDTLLQKLSQPSLNIGDVLEHAGVAAESSGDATLNTAKAIEIGHNFYFGQKYTQGVSFVQSKDNKPVPFEMGSYGIGVSRIAAALIECFHDDKGIIWPENMAPFHVHLVGLGLHDSSVAEHLNTVYTTLINASVEVLYDNRPDHGAGFKLSDAELIGCPWIIVAGKKSLTNNLLEVRHRKTGAIEHMSCEQFIAKIAATKAHL